MLHCSKKLRVYKTVVALSYHGCVPITGVPISEVWSVCGELNEKANEVEAKSYGGDILPLYDLSLRG